MGNTMKTILKIIIILCFMTTFSSSIFAKEEVQASFAVKNCFKKKYNVKWDDATVDAQKKFLDNWNKEVIKEEKKDQARKEIIQDKLDMIHKQNLDHEKLIENKKKVQLKKEELKKKEVDKRKRNLSKKKSAMTKKINNLKRKSEKFHKND